MASEKKKRKTDKRLHWGRGQSFCKTKGKGIKGLDYYTPSQRQVDKKIDLDFVSLYLLIQVSLLYTLLT